VAIAAAAQMTQLQGTGNREQVTGNSPQVNASRNLGTDQPGLLTGSPETRVTKNSEQVTGNKLQAIASQGQGADQPRPSTPNPETQLTNPAAPPPHLNPQQLQFLLRVTPAALESEREYGIPACITVAQAILESATPKLGWGSSSLFRLANNPFGIKYGHTGSGDRVIGRPGEQEKADHQITGSSDHPIQPYGHFDASTWEVVDGQKKEMIAEFQRFPNLAEAFRAHARLLLTPHYRPAYEVRHDWKQFAERLGPPQSPLDRDHCGYATNPNYSALLINLVTLYRLNDPRIQQWLATGHDPGPSPAGPSPGIE